MFHSYRVGARLGFLSVPLAIAPVLFILVPEAFPPNDLTGYLVIYGGVGGSLLMALGAGVIGSRWWFFALLGPAISIVLLLVNPRFLSTAWYSALPSIWSSSFRVSERCSAGESR